MKKIFLIVVLLSLTVILSSTTSKVHASPVVVTFNQMNSGVKDYTDEYGTTPYSWFRAQFYSLSTTPGGNACTTTNDTELKVTQRSVAGATGSTVYVKLGYAKLGGNNFYYGDEDVYYEVTLLNVNGDCRVVMVIDPDY
jgi:hypothetical protein